jgi:hypothetical protein
LFGRLIIDLSKLLFNICAQWIDLGIALAADNNGLAPSGSGSSYDWYAGPIESVKASVSIDGSYYNSFNSGNAHSGYSTGPWWWNDSGPESQRGTFFMAILNTGVDITTGMLTATASVSNPGELLGAAVKGIVRSGWLAMSYPGWTYRVRAFKRVGT